MKIPKNRPAPHTQEAPSTSEPSTEAPPLTPSEDNLTRALDSALQSIVSPLTQAFKSDTRPSGVRISQQDLDDLLQQLNDLPKPVALAKLLRSHGYETTLQDLDFARSRLVGTRAPGVGLTPIMGTALYHDVDFSGLHFNDCSFDELNLKGSTFQNTHFTHCSLKKTILLNATVNNTTFSDCDLSHALLDHATINQSVFGESNLRSLNACHATLKDTTFSDSNLEAANLWGADVSGGVLAHCNLRNTLLFDAKAGFTISGETPNTIVSPVVALLWNPEFPGMSGSKVVDRLEARDTVVFKLDYVPQQSDPGALSQDILRALDVLGSGTNVDTAEASKAQELLTLVAEAPDTYPTLSALLQRTADVVPFLNGIILPGGADVEAELYNQTLSSTEKEAPHDYRRTIMEFALLKHARRGVPLLGLCRGAQLANVFYGGNLRNVRGQWAKVQSYTIQRPSDQSEGFLHPLTGSDLLGASAHNQAIDVIGDDLEVVVRYDGMPKAVESKLGVPLIATQFHPEFHGDKTSLAARGLTFVLSDANAGVWDGFRTCTEAHRAKQAALSELKAKKSKQ